MTLNNILQRTGNYINTRIDEIRNNPKIKTDERRKKALVELWNWSIDRAMEQTKSQYDRAVLRCFYGSVNAITLGAVTIDEAFKLVTKWSNVMISMKGEWK